jgi:hypothetical protein
VHLSPTSTKLFDRIENGLSHPHTPSPTLYA